MINTEKQNLLAAAEWAYLPNGRTPKGTTLVPGVPAGAYVRDDATPPPADLAADVALIGIVEGDGGNAEAVVFDGRTVEYDGRTWYSFGTISSFAFAGWTAYSAGGFVEVEETIPGDPDALDDGA